MTKRREMYVVLTDVVASRNIPDRKKFKKLFDKALDAVNTEFAAQLVLPMQGWKGLDETAALLKSPACLYRLLDHLNNGLAPEQIRMVLVKGMVEVPPAEANITRADGPAFHQAAAKMMELKQRGLLLACETGEEEEDQLLEMNINALLLLKSGWTERQRLVYAQYQKSGSQQAVAQALNITQQTVSKTLKTLKAAQVAQLEQSLEAWMSARFK